MIREPVQQPDGETARPHNAAVDNIRQNKPVTSEGDVTVRGTHKPASFPIFGLDAPDFSEWAFDVDCDDVNAYVNGGYWRIDGYQEAYSTCPSGSFVAATADSIGYAVLPLSGSTVFVCVRSPVASYGAEIIGMNVRPLSNDATYHYRVLCKCVAMGDSYAITERYWRGDIVEAAPLP